MSKSIATVESVARKAGYATKGIKIVEAEMLYSSKQYPFSINQTTLKKYPDRVFSSDNDDFDRRITLLGDKVYCCALKKSTKTLYIAERSWSNRDPRPF